MKKWILALAVIAFIAALSLAAIDIFRPYRGYSGEVIVDIPPGMQAPEVATRLVEKGVLAHRAPFLLIYGAGRWRHHLKAGEYLFNHPLRPLDVYRKIVRGDVYFRTVVIPEGSNRFDIARILQRRLGIDPEDFLRVTQEASLVHDLDPQAPSLEGYLFPDTYRFEFRPSAAHIAMTMLARFREVLHEGFLKDLSHSDENIHQVMTLASLIEKETPDPDERPIIAQVFGLRLQKRMLLQCDPSVAYAAEMVHLPPAPITESDLNRRSPYNTYVHTGLPPGPICNPGKASILAALHPASTDFLYFVSNNHGSHQFARTLPEHQRNVARYRKQAAALRRLSPDKAEISQRPHKK
ncbi:MAG: endolytic transglycosylase MltG [Acidobacteria bacterium]|nr:MAG: endolytic transglycosylase MltG [Acidobacteriota bacterium]